MAPADHEEITLTNPPNCKTDGTSDDKLAGEQDITSNPPNYKTDGTSDDQLAGEQDMTDDISDDQMDEITHMAPADHVENTLTNPPNYKTDGNPDDQLADEMDSTVGYPHNFNKCASDYFWISTQRENDEGQDWRGDTQGTGCCLLFSAQTAQRNLRQSATDVKIREFNNSGTSS